MATPWTNPIAPGSPIQAFDVQQVINAINTNRSAAGLPPFPWTDPVVSSGTPIKALHFTQMRAAIQDLWNVKWGVGAGHITTWRAYGVEGPGPSPEAPIYAQDLLDVRRWLNQYEDAPSPVTVTPLKGMHMPAGGIQFRAVDAWALEEGVPSFGMLVALSRDLDSPSAAYTSQSGNTVTMATVMEWYANNRGTELFVRLYPGPGPVPGTGDERYVQRTFSQAVDDIVAFRNARGPSFRRIYPGNEPNIEWPNPGDYHDSAGNPVHWVDARDPNKYRAMNAYYKEILDELNVRKSNGQAPADIELWYPSMAQANGAEGRSSPDMMIVGYCDNGLTIDLPGQRRYDYLQQSIELYGRFTWNNYFFSAHPVEGCVANYFPDWLKNDLYTLGMPSRIMELGWWPENREHRIDRDSPAGPYQQYDCNDANPTPPITEGTYSDNLIQFITQSRSGTSAPASGVAVWLLSTADPANFGRHAAVRTPEGDQKLWYRGGPGMTAFKLWQP